MKVFHVAVSCRPRARRPSQLARPRRITFRPRAMQPRAALLLLALVAAVEWVCAARAYRAQLGPDAWNRAAEALAARKFKIE